MDTRQIINSMTQEEQAQYTDRLFNPPPCDNIEIHFHFPDKMDLTPVFARGYVPRKGDIFCISTTNFATGIPDPDKDFRGRWLWKVKSVVLNLHAPSTAKDSFLDDTYYSADVHLVRTYTWHMLKTNFLSRIGWYWLWRNWPYRVAWRNWKESKTQGGSSHEV